MMPLPVDVCHYYISHAWLCDTNIQSVRSLLNQTAEGSALLLTLPPLASGARWNHGANTTFRMMKFISKTGRGWHSPSQAEAMKSSDSLCYLPDVFQKVQGDRRWQIFSSVLL
jgi:hypothetical protein